MGSKFSLIVPAAVPAAMKEPRPLCDQARVALRGVFLTRIDLIYKERSEENKIEAKIHKQVDVSQIRQQVKNGQAAAVSGTTLLLNYSLRHP